MDGGRGRDHLWGYLTPTTGDITGGPGRDAGVQRGLPGRPAAAGRRHPRPGPGTLTVRFTDAPPGGAVTDVTSLRLPDYGRWRFVGSEADEALHGGTARLVARAAAATTACSARPRTTCSSAGPAATRSTAATARTGAGPSARVPASRADLSGSARSRQHDDRSVVHVDRTVTVSVLDEPREECGRLLRPERPDGALVAAERQTSSVHTPSGVSSRARTLQSWCRHSTVMTRPPLGAWPTPRRRPTGRPATRGPPRRSARSAAPRRARWPSPRHLV